MTTSNQHRRAKDDDERHNQVNNSHGHNPVMDWYVRTTGILMDRMCCGSYTDDMYDEPLSQQPLRTTAVSPATSSAFFEPRGRQQQQQPPYLPGHLTLDPSDFKDRSRRGKHALPQSPDRSVGTTATVASTISPTTAPSTISTASTVRTAPSRSRYSSHSTSSDSQTQNSEEQDLLESQLSFDLVVDRDLTLREIDVPRVPYVPRNHLYHRQSSDLARKSPCDVRSIQDDDSLSNLPYLTLTEGYPC